MTITCQAYNGVLNSVIPGARRLRIVTIKLIAPMVELAPVMIMPRAQKSMPWVGEYWELVSGAYANQPALGAPPRTKELYNSNPPSKKNQRLKAFSRGKAISRAPIIKGTI